MKNFALIGPTAANDTENPFQLKIILAAPICTKLLTNEGNTIQNDLKQTKW